MKKFLTVLLALSVVFTYSFSAVGTVFADTPANNEQSKLIAAARDYVEKTAIPASVTKAVANVGSDDYITDAAWNKIAPEVTETLQKEVETVANNYLANATTLPTDWNAYPNDVAYTAQKLFTETYYYSYTALIAKLNSDWKAEAAKAQFAINYDEIVSVYDKIDVDALYSKTSPSAANSYNAQARKAISDSKDTLKAYFFDDQGNVKGVGDAYDSVIGAENTLKVWVTDGYKDEVVKATGVASEKWEGTNVVKYYYLNDANIKTIAQEDADKVITDAEVAAMKAEAAKVYAQYVAQPNADNEYAKAWLEVVNALIDEREVTTAPTLEGMNYGANEKNEYIAAVENAKDLKAYAAKYKAEKDSLGNFVRDAEAVDALVDAYIVDAYGRAAGVITAGTPVGLQATKNEIANMSVKEDAAKLLHAKEVEKVKLANELEAKLENYYDLEAEKVKAAYNAASAKVDAATAKDDFAAIEADLAKDVKKIATDKQVEDLFTGTPATAMTTEFNKQVAALKAYLTYKNSALEGKPYDDAYVVYDKDKLSEILRAHYIDNNVRTLDELKALTNAVEEVAKTFPTNAELAAAKKVAEDAAKALPAASKITAADKDAVVAAYELIDAYEDLAKHAGVNPASISIDPQVNALYNAIQGDIMLAYAKADKNDKAALKAIKDSVDAANEELADIMGPNRGFTVPNGLEAALDKIKASEFAAVKAAINNLPINPTLEDKAAIEEARKLYNDYVAEYTTYDPNHNAANEFGNGEARSLALAEAALSVLEKDAQIKAVESFKIKVTTKRYTGKKMRVNWTVKGDESAIDGYRVYFSTKKTNSSYKYLTKTTKKYINHTSIKKSVKKGTRVYYRVRAYKDIDGVRYFSDYSTVGNRIWK